MLGREHVTSGTSPTASYPPFISGAYSVGVSADELVVETDGLTKRFGRRVAVDRVDLEIPRGSAFGYLGPNGAGKTTLIRMLLGLTRPSAGTSRLLGRPMPRERRAALARVGAIVEEPSFHKHLTGRENLWIVAAAREPAAHDRIGPALARTGLADRADDRVSTYSQGMRQRLGLARCLLADPELLILDEPTNGLDPAGIQEFRGFVASLVAEGRTVVLSSHLLDEVEKMCDHVAIVDQGRIVAQGPISELASGEDATILVGCEPLDAACAALDGSLPIERIEEVPGGLRLVLRKGANVERTAADINRLLVHADVAVHRLEPGRVSLEQRFLEITSRLGEAA
jgi:ABC-2 type transport system ATP-binding protein